MAYDGVQAMGLVKEHHPDILVLDLMLPECDGLAVLKAIGDMDNKPAVIMTSSFVTDFVAYKDEDLGARYIMLKPINKSVLVERLLEFSN